MAIDPWTQLRQLLYPIAAAASSIWVVAFYLRAKATNCAGDTWAGRLSLAILVWSFTGTIGIWIGRASGYSSITSAIFTAGVGLVTIVLVIGAVLFWRGAWRSPRPPAP